MANFTCYLMAVRTFGIDSLSYYLAFIVAFSINRRSCRWHIRAVKRDIHFARADNKQDLTQLLIYNSSTGLRSWQN